MIRGASSSHYAAAWPLVVRAQQAALPVIGVLSGRSLDDSKEFVEAFGKA